jgi:hypothetical protein
MAAWLHLSLIDLCNAVSVQLFTYPFPLTCFLCTPPTSAPGPVSNRAGRGREEIKQKRFLFISTADRSIVRPRKFSALPGMVPRFLWKPSKFTTPPIETLERRDGREHSSQASGGELETHHWRASEAAQCSHNRSRFPTPPSAQGAPHHLQPPGLDPYRTPWPCCVIWLEIRPEWHSCSR